MATTIIVDPAKLDAAAAQMDVQASESDRQ